MAKRTTNKRERKELDLKGIAIILAVIAAAWILYTNIAWLIAAIMGSFILVVIILVVGAYFVLPRLGITGLAALLSLGKK